MKGLTNEVRNAIGKRRFCLWIRLLAQLKIPLAVIDIARMTIREGENANILLAKGYGWDVI
jgi:hypothetical protein